MVEPGALKLAGEALESASSYLEYWRHHKGEEVVIRQQDTVKDDSGYKVVAYKIRGTIDGVLSEPEGFILTDVRESLRESGFSMMYGMGSTDVQNVAPSVQGEVEVRKVEEKFVAFSEITQLEKADVADDSVEPFRE